MATDWVSMDTVPDASSALAIPAAVKTKTINKTNDRR